MIIKPQVKAQALEVYQQYWDSYTKGDLEPFASTLDDQFEMIGTSESERCHTKADGIEFLKAQLHEVVGKAEMRNRQIDVVPIDHLVLINEQCDIYVLIGSDWNFYSKIRISTLLRETKEGWKVTQQHGSLPDMRVGEGETIALEKISKENLELRDAVKRRTAELENKNRELAIEAALERVRAMTMAMRSSEDVGKCIVKMFSELTELGVDEGTRFGIGILNHENENNQLWTARKNGEEVNMHIGNIDMASHPLLKSARQAWKEQVPFHRYVLEGEDLLNYYQMLNNAPDYKIQIPLEHLPKREIQHCFIFEHGFFYAFSPWEFQPELIQITKRFSALFEQTYRRYLDLVRAESQAREAEIELALERVRARTMAMHHTEELKEVIQVVFDQLIGLNIHVEHAGFILDYKERGDMHIWLADHQQGVPTEITIPYFDSPHWNSYLEAKAKQESFFDNLLPFEVKNKFYRDLFEWIPELTEEAQQAIFSKPALAISTVLMDTVGLYIEHYSEIPFTAEENKILMRFGKVFQQTYTRFLDLEKAESQAREAQIQLSLERIRAKAMSMQHSDELSDFLTVLFEQFEVLYLNPVFCHLSLLDLENNRITYRMTGRNGARIFSSGKIDLDISSIWNNKIQELKSGRPREVDVMYFPNEIIPEISRHVKDMLGNPPENELPKLDDFPDGQYVVEGYSKYGYLGYSASRPPSDEEKEITRRIAHEFGNVYQRFLDLQKAESQARESEIEVALEKVRSRSLAMHKSDELKDVVFSVFERLRDLQIQTDSTNIVVYFDEIEKMEFWTANDMNYAAKFSLPMTGRFYPIEGIKARNEQKFFLQHLSFEEKNRFWEELFQTADFRKVPEIRKTFLLEKTDCLIQLIAFGKFTGIMLNRHFNTPFNDAEIEIAERFAKVFDQAYTRFLDLQKAETQAREAQIEAALERVRSRSLAMHGSDELNEVVMVLFERLNDLQIPVTAVGISINIEGSKDLDNYTCGLVESGIAINNYRLPYFDHRIANDFFEAREKQLDFFVGNYSKQEKDSFYEYVIKHTELKNELTEDIKQFIFQSPSYSISVVTTKNTMITLNDFEGKSLSDDEIDILKRFAKVFEQTYTRFLDLQKAEAQALEATKQASLDRIRGVIASMRFATDLELITPLIFKELTVLGIPFIRCGVFIINEKQELVEAYLSSPEGNSLGVLRLPYQASELTYQTVEAWRRGEIYRQHWDKEDFIQWIKQLMEQDQIQDSRTYQGTAAPPESLDLHFVPFAQGMLYVGAVNPLDEKELELVQALAKAFSIAYARYEDFVKLELAKAEVESAMSELKATQSQLVQQEKLASLGQLTAGIAHEIKNPLNFVNNFSEVSLELIEEAMEEISQIEANEHASESAEILADIKSNLKKIHEHGTRANSIVSSMLQHSRGGTGKMEPTDINGLIKEYVNLSFHGMRAGKNPIDVEIDLNLDSEIKEVPLIKEDFSRVIINLCNNAFDAMRRKKYEVPSTKYQEVGGNGLDYLPKLRVSTILENGQVRISFEDNGPGIPDEIKDKILQPFFTTKKGTEGTGLGLSITHDIIKAHGGELKLGSNLGKGAQFDILLFLNSTGEL